LNINYTVALSLESFSDEANGPLSKARWSFNVLAAFDHDTQPIAIGITVRLTPNERQRIALPFCPSKGVITTVESVN
jgi:hypothetical protein